jgi:multisubunit Na+/H+ antiporter MnhC subunit
MEVILALAIGVMTSAGVWLVLRPRTFQVIIGLSLLSYAVNLFIFAAGKLKPGAAAIVDKGTVIVEKGAEVVEKGAEVAAAAYADPVPQALVLTAIVISFATTALFLVILLMARGLSGSDHVDGREP